MKICKFKEGDKVIYRKELCTERHSVYKYFFKNDNLYTIYKIDFDNIIYLKEYPGGFDATVFITLKDYRKQKLGIGAGKRTRKSGERKCGNCGEVGHNARSCPNPKKKGKAA